jgi:hypothetical protein
VLDFVLILVVTGGALAGIGRGFWRTRSARTLLEIGAGQALFGL